MESVSHLRAVLLNCLGPRGSQRSEQQLFDELLMQSYGLIVKLGGLIQCGFEVLNLLSELVQQVVTLAGISRP